MGILNVVFDEMNSAADEIVNQTLGMKPGKKRRRTSSKKRHSQGRRIVMNVYKEIHNHRHFYDFKDFNKK
ncbi:hypothetical protein LLG96_14190 [bacterium]|nr:hypothetical protein [bacterium]